MPYPKVTKPSNYGTRAQPFAMLNYEIERGRDRERKTVREREKDREERGGESGHSAQLSSKSPSRFGARHSGPLTVCALNHQLILKSLVCTSLASILFYYIFGVIFFWDLTIFSLFLYIYIFILIVKTCESETVTR